MTYKTYDAESRKFLNHFGNYVREQFGSPCPDYDPECCVCKMWHAYNLVADVILDEERISR